LPDPTIRREDESLTPLQSPINLKVSAGSEQSSTSIRQQVKGMVLRYLAAFVLCAIAFSSSAYGQVVRFETTMGDFDMVLNPTNNPRLQGHVDNMLSYIENNAYRASWINRADEGFVLQMGGFYTHTRRPPLTIDSTSPVATFDPVPGEPGINGLSNTAGTVALALPGGAGGTNQDGGTSSFFVNVGSNTFLDTDFTVFAAIADMTVVNEIMALMQVDRTTDPMFGAGPGNLAFTDVPIQDNGFQVFITRAFVLNDPLAITRARGAVGATMALSEQSFAAASNASSLSPGLPVSAIAIPEPATLLTAAIAAVAMWLGASRWR
jgi:cyclophilin family peptidyl-prolyl cis-trans isomerase